MYINM